MHFRSNQEYLRYMTSGTKPEDLRETEKLKREAEQAEEKPKRGKKA